MRNSQRNRAASNPAILRLRKAEAVMEECSAGTWRRRRLCRFDGAEPTAVQVQDLRDSRGVRRNATTVFAAGETRPAGMVDTCGTGGDGSTRLIFRRGRRLCCCGRCAASEHGNRARVRKVVSRCAGRLGVRTICRSNDMGSDSGMASVFCSRRRRTRRRGMPLPRAQRIGVARSSICWATHESCGRPMQVLGVFSADVIDLMAATLAELGVERQVCGAWRWRC